MVVRSLDPNDFIDDPFADEDGYDPEEITYADFTIVPGDEVNHAALVYNKRGIEGSDMKWGINMYYGYRYNGPTIPIAPHWAKRILENLSPSGDSIEDFEWSEHDWFYAE